MNAALCYTGSKLKGEVIRTNSCIFNRAKPKACLILKEHFVERYIARVLGVLMDCYVELT